MKTNSELNILTVNIIFIYRKNGKRSGNGRCSFVSFIYDGEWRDDEFHGFGVKTFSNGDRYEGTWVLGKMEGKGKYVSHEGWTYEGQFKFDQRHGVGKTYYPSGDIVCGAYYNDRFRNGNFQWADPQNPGSYMTVSKMA